MIKTTIRCILLISLLISANSTLAQDVGVAWYGKSGMAKRVLVGIQDRLTEVAPAIKLDLRTDLTSLEDLDAVMKEFDDNGNAAQIILRSNGAVRLKAFGPKIPSFIGATNNPVELGVVDDMELPGGNITGVTYHLPIVNTIESFMLLHPYMDTVLLINQTGHPSSAIDWRDTKKACDELGLTCSQELAANRSEIIQIVEDSIGQYSAFIMGNQVKIYTNTDAIIATDSETPLFSFSEKGVLNGAAGGVTTDDYRLGQLLADSLVSVVLHGNSTASLPILRDPNPRLVINMQAVERYGLAPAASILGIADLIE